MRKVSSRITEALTRDVFGQKLIDNNFRGPWTEYMVAEALGDECVVVSHSWHAWDLQLGNSEDTFPARIRIQVKNTARLQTWHRPNGRLTNCQWMLKMRRKPYYFDTYNPNVPCEDYGYMCDVFVLCHHPVEDPEIADHRDPNQWEFYVVPVTPHHRIFPIKAGRQDQKTSSSYTVVPASLGKGIRGRPPIKPLSFDQLSPASIRSSLDA